MTKFEENSMQQKASKSTDASIKRKLGDVEHLKRKKSVRKRQTNASAPPDKRQMMSTALQAALSWSVAVKQMRLTLGLTQVEFCRLFGLSRKGLADLETGRGNPTVKTLNRLGRAFGLTVGYIPLAEVRLAHAASSNTISTK
jgi:DNA-binding XRE family transcriptional regulator